MIDHHLHTNFGDGENSVDEMVQAAAEAGFTQIAFTEHFDLIFVRFANSIPSFMDYTILPKEVEDFYNQCRAAEQKYGIKVLKGFELNYTENDEDALKAFVEANKPDLIQLAVHRLDLLRDWTRTDGREDKAGYSVYLGGESLAELNKQYGSFEKLIEAYFRRLNNAIDAGFGGLCENVGIPHLVVFSHKGLYDGQIARPFVDEAIEHIVDNGLALEVNFHYHPILRPSLDTAKRLLDLGGKLWFGSDSHKVDEIRDAAKHYGEFERLMDRQVG